MFSSAAQAVLEEYRARLADEDALMAAGDPARLIPRRDEFLLPVGPETGAFLHAFVVGLGATRILELGTSYGYSTLFLAAAAKATGGEVITVDTVHEKQDYARAMLKKAELGDVVDWRIGDAIDVVEADPGAFDFVLLDIWKDAYLPALQAVYPKLADEGVIVADNMIHPDVVRPEARAYRAAVAALPDMTSTLLPIGSGIEVSCRWKPGNEKI